MQNLRYINKNYKTRTVNGRQVNYTMFDIDNISLGMILEYTSQGNLMFATTNNKVYFSNQPVYKRAFTDSVIPRTYNLSIATFNQGSIVYSERLTKHITKEKILDTLVKLPYTYCVSFIGAYLVIFDYRFNIKNTETLTYENIGFKYKEIGMTYSKSSWKGFMVGSEIYTTGVDQWTKMVEPPKGYKFPDLNYRLFRDKVLSAMWNVENYQSFAFEDIWYDYSDTPGDYKESGYWYVGSRANNSKEGYLRDKDILKTLRTNTYKGLSIKKAFTSSKEFNLLTSKLTKVGDSYYKVDLNKKSSNEFLSALFRFLVYFGKEVFLHFDFQTNCWYMAFNSKSYTDGSLSVKFNNCLMIGVYERVSVQNG